MIINDSDLIIAAPIKGMVRSKVSEHGVSYGLGEAGYDIRIKQEIIFRAGKVFSFHSDPTALGWYWDDGHFCLASAIEEFQMPDNLVGIVHDKSSWARQGLSVFNTVIEPGWKGFLTLELVYQGQSELIIPAGAGIAQVVFHQTSKRVAYSGKYQNQDDRPVAAIKSE